MFFTDSAHLPAPLPLYIGQRTLIDECPPYVFFTLFVCLDMGKGLGHNLLTSLCNFPPSATQKWKSFQICFLIF